MGVRSWYAWTSIFDVDAQLPSEQAEQRVTRCPFWAVLHRVVHERQDRLFHPHRVHPDETGRQEPNIEGRVVFRGQRAPARRSRPASRARASTGSMRKGGVADSERARKSKSSTIRDIVDDSLTISRRISSCSQWPSRSSPTSALPSDHGERGSQLVGDLGEELGPGAGGSSQCPSRRACVR